VRDHAPSVPAAAAAALARGMSSEPAERQRSAGELAFELANALERGRRERSETRTLPLAASAPVPRTAPPVAPPASRTSASRRARSFAGPLAAVLILLAAAAVVAAVLLAGGNDGDKPQADRPTQQEQREQAQSPAQSDEASPDEGETGQTTETNPAEPDPAESAPADAPIDPAQGTALNEQGYALMQQGDYAGAVPVLRRAVASWPEDSTDLDYAYALYNLGASLNRSGSPAEAIPYLEKRLNWSNQRGVVKRELEDAQRNAGQG
jgi:eukaryotic-like serine/threonine-protein kinase